MEKTHDRVNKDELWRMAEEYEVKSRVKYIMVCMKGVDND